MSMRIRGLFLVAAITMFPPTSGAARNYDSGKLKKDVQYSELIVQGTITSLRTAMMPRNQVFLPQSSNPDFPITVIEIEVRDVIKGRWDSPTVRASLPGDPRAGGYGTGTTYNYEIGEEVILCLHYDPKIVGDHYRLWGDLGSFVKRADVWMTRDGSALVWPEDIVALSATVDPVRMARDADVVVVGVIENVELREFDCGFPITCKGDYLTVRVNQTWKGAKRGETILVRVLRRGSNLSWFAPIPPVTAGESYLMFLMKDEVGYYPFVGFNGFLEVQDEKLIMNGYVEYPLSRARVLTMVQEELGQ